MADTPDTAPRDAPPDVAPRGAGNPPTLDDVRGRLSISAWQDPSDEADAGDALAAAVAYVTERSTRYRVHGWNDTVRRGTVDLTVALYERRGSTTDPFDGLTPATRTAFHRLLGISRHALPHIGGAP